MAEAKRKAVQDVAELQAILDRGMGQYSQRLGMLGAAYDQQLTPPVARFGAAAERMGKQVDGSLAQTRIEQAATARELQRAAQIADAAATVQENAAERAARAYAAQAAAAKASADAQEEAAGRIGPPTLQEFMRGGIGPNAPGVTATERIIERHTGGGVEHPIFGVRGPTAAGSIGNPLVVVVEAASRTSLGSLAAAVGESPVDRGSITTIAQPGGGGGGASVVHASSSTGGGGTTVISSGGWGGGGGGVPPVVVPAGGGGDRGGGGMLSKLLWGGGSGIPLLGGAAAGALSVGAFAGFDLLHYLTTAGALVGSAGGAALGGGMLALGGAGQLAVGGGSDLAVMRTTLAQTKELGTAYANVQKAVATYGAESKQAALAQRELNVLMAELGNTSAVKAELGLAKAKEALGDFWSEQTTNARVQGVHILTQLVNLGTAYVPKVAQAAQSNLAIINEGIKPLFSWLTGPEGMGVFNVLEQRFRSNLPSAVHAFDQAVELLLKTTREASGYTGGFTQTLDRFFTKWNSAQFFPVWRTEISRLVDDFRLWESLIKVAGEDIYYLFSRDAGTGNAIVSTMRNMLVELREWERSTRGSEQLRTLFTVHKEEIIALLKVLPPLLSAFGSIYMTIAPPLVRAVTGVAEAFSAVLTAITNLGPVARDVLGGALVAWKLGLLGGAISSINKGVLDLGRNMLGLGVAEKKFADMTASEYAAATGAGRGAAGATAAEAAAGGSLLARAGGLGMLLKGGLLAAGGGIAGGLGASALGLSGLAKTAASTAGIGAGLGFVGAPAADAILGTTIGGPLGAAVGFGLGAATPYVVSFLESAFSIHAPDYGKRFAAGFVAPIAPMLTRRTSEELEGALHTDRKATVAARAEAAALSGPSRGNPGGASSARGVQAFNRAFLAELHEGLTAAEGLKAALAGVSHPTTFAFVTDTARQLKGLSGEARAAAAEAMVKYAVELEHQGKLPKGAVAVVIRQLEQQFPALVGYFKSHALQASAEVAAAMKMEQSKTNLAKSLNDLRAEWGLFNVDPVVNGKNWLHNTGVAMDDLRKIIATSTGSAKKEAEQHLDELQGHTNATFFAMARSTDTNMKALAKNVTAHIPGAVGLVESEFKNFQTAVLSAVEGGALGAGVGSKLIAEALNKELIALGGKPIPIANISIAGKVLGAAAVTQGGQQHRAAGGGLYQIGNPGERGHDTIPMRVGGHELVVGAGEQAAIINSHQQAFLDRELSHVGGLAGVFSAVSTPHYMAEGGMIAKGIAKANEISSRHYPYAWGGGHNSAFSGPYDCSGADSAVLHAMGVLSKAEVSGELMNFGAPGPGAVTIYANPVHAFMSIMGKFFGTHGAEGAGWYPGSPLPGFVQRHVPGLTGEGLAGMISAPSVKGGGIMGAMLRSGLGKVAGAANHYLAGHAFGAASGSNGGANLGQMVPGIMGIEQQAAQMAGLAWNPSIVAALLSHESSGGVNEPPSGPLHATGPNQVIPGTFAAYALPGHNDIANPLDNAIASFRYIKSRYGSLAAMAAATGLLGGGYKGYAGGGIIGAAKGLLAHAASAHAARVAKPKGVPHVPRVPKAKALSLKHLITSLGAIPGMASISGQLGPVESQLSALTDEATLISSMTSNPASILQSDMGSLGPTLLAGEHIGPGMLVTGAEREQQRTLQKYGESEGLTSQAALLQWIGGLDDHRLLSALDIGVLAKDAHGVTLRPGSGVFQGQVQVLEAQKGAQEHAAALMRQQKDLAHRLIRARIKRKQAIENLLKVAFQRYQNLQRRLRAMKAAGLRRHLSEAERRSADKQTADDARQHRAALQQAIATEKEMNPWEQNRSLLRTWQAEERQLATVISTPSSSGAVTNAREALERNELENRVAPISESLHFLGGSSTSIGAGGELGAVTKQVTSLEGGSRELDGKIREAVEGTIPQLALSIGGIRNALSEAAEAVAPAKIPGTAGAASNESELAGLLKTQNQHLSQQLAVSQAQYKVFAEVAAKPIIPAGHLPPFAGKFHDGGVVPGPLGADMMALVQGGEVIHPAGATTTHKVIVEDGAVDPNKIRVIADQAVRRGTRAMARDAGTPLPSRGGGQLG